MDPIVDFVLRFGSITVALAAFGWSVWQYRQGARKAEIDAVNRRIDGVAQTIGSVADELGAHKDAGQASRAELSERLGNVEVALQHMPDKDTVHRLELAVADIRGDVKTQGEAVRGLADNVRGVAASGERIESYLLQAKK